MSDAAHGEGAANYAPPRPAPRRAGLAAGTAVFAYAADQGTKAWVEAALPLGEKVEVVPGLLRWHHILNPGAAFSIGTDVTWVFTIVQALVAVAALVTLARVRSLAWALCLGGLAGGVLGNLTDRLFRPPSFGMGHVVDMVSVPNFAVFNVADSFIVCSMLGLALLVLTGRHMDGTVDGGRDDADTAERR